MAADGLERLFGGFAHGILVSMTRITEQCGRSRPPVAAVGTGASPDVFRAALEALARSMRPDGEVDLPPVSDLARMLAMPRSRVQRELQRLLRSGAVSRNSSARLRYHPSPATGRIARDRIGIISRTWPIPGSDITAFERIPTADLANQVALLARRLQAILVYDSLPEVQRELGCDPRPLLRQLAEHDVTVCCYSDPHESVDTLFSDVSMDAIHGELTRRLLAAGCQGILPVCRDPHSVQAMIGNQGCVLAQAGSGRQPLLPMTVPLRQDLTSHDLAVHLAGFLASESCAFDCLLVLDDDALDEAVRACELVSARRPVLAVAGRISHLHGGRRHSRPPSPPFQVIAAIEEPAGRMRHLVEALQSQSGPDEARLRVLQPSFTLQA